MEETTTTEQETTTTVADTTTTVPETTTTVAETTTTRPEVTTTTIVPSISEPTSIVVVTAPGELPITGATPWPGIIIGTMAILIGVLVYRWSLRHAK